MLTLASLAFASSLSICVYRVWFHPLRKHPGPLLCKLTSLIWVYHFIRGSILEWEAQQHQSYGVIVRLGPNRLSFIDPNAWKDIYGHKPRGSGKPNVKNLDRAVKGTASGNLPMALDPSPAGHAAQRKAFNPAFSERAWREQEPLVERYIGQLLHRVRKAMNSSADGGAILDMAELWNFLTFDVMGDLTFGEGLGQLETGIESSWVHVVFVMFKFLNKKSVIKAYPLGGMLFDLFAPKDMMRDAAKHIAHCSGLVQKRLEKVSDGRPDILGFVLGRSKETMPRTQLDANANMFMVAGTETTATTLTTITHQLLHNPDKMRKLLLEIRAVSSKSELTSDNLLRMPYLNTVINEALRREWISPFPVLSPHRKKTVKSFQGFPIGQVGLGTQREIAEGGDWVCDNFLAEETEVSVAAWTMNNSHIHWKDPHKFVPERWLPTEVEFAEYHNVDNRDAWLAFGTGPRTCIGRNIALNEIRGGLAKFLYEFDLAPTAETGDWLRNKIESIWAKPTLLARVTMARC